MDVQEFAQFNWEHTYNIRKSRQRDPQNALRSAEFVARLNRPEGSWIPARYIRRIIGFTSDAVPIDYLGSTHRIAHCIKEDRTIANLDDPLYDDKRFWESLAKLSSFDLSFDDIAKAVTALVPIEADIGCSLKGSFDKSSIAEGVHGVGHVTRVMFWVIFLAHLARQYNHKVTEADIKAAVIAAFFHDLCRTTNQPDAWHGEDAVRTYGPFIGTKLAPEDQARCLTAIAYHCKDVPPPNPDIVWQLLKDADALDRGRFRPPEQEGGCGLDRLTLPLWHEQRRLLRECGWLAYWLARVTKFTNWSDSTVVSLSDSLVRSWKACSEARQPANDEGYLVVRDALRVRTPV